MVAAPPPPDLGMLVTFAAPETDLKRLAALTSPEMAASVGNLVDEFRNELGPGLGSKVDLARPAFLATGSDPDALVAFSVALKRPLGENLAQHLELTARSPASASIRPKEGETHEWLEQNACDVYFAPKPNGQLVCAPDHEQLTGLGDYLAKLQEHPPATPRPIQIDAFPALFRKAFDDGSLQELGVDPGADLKSASLVVNLDGSGVELVGDLRLKDAASATAAVLLGPQTAVAPPPDFPEAPNSSLFAVSLSGLNERIAVAVMKELLASSTSSKAGADADELAASLGSLMARGPLAFAYGIDLNAAKKNLKAWVAADAKAGAAAPRPGVFEAVASWKVLRLDGGPFDDLLTKLTRGNLGPGALRRVPLKASEKLPNGTLHVIWGTGSAPDLDPEAGPLHVFLVRRPPKSLLVAISHREGVARDALRAALKSDSKRADAFRVAKQSKAYGVGVLRHEVFAATNLNWISSYSREQSLRSLEALKPPLGSTAKPGYAPNTMRIEQFVERAPAPRMSVVLSVPKPAVDSLLRTFEDL